MRFGGRPLASWSRLRVCLRRARCRCSRARVAPAAVGPAGAVPAAVARAEAPAGACLRRVVAPGPRQDRPVRVAECRPRRFPHRDHRRAQAVHLRCRQPVRRAVLPAVPRVVRKLRRAARVRRARTAARGHLRRPPRDQARQQRRAPQATKATAALPATARAPPEVPVPARMRRVVERVLARAARRAGHLRAGPAAPPVTAWILRAVHRAVARLAKRPPAQRAVHRMRRPAVVRPGLPGQQLLAPRARGLKPVPERRTDAP